MERLGLVAQLEKELERIISLGQLPKDGELPSEQTLARRYGVSRSTAREALLRLAARGLVVQHPGRRARAVALDEALTLENLGLALHGEGGLSQERRLLLEGYLSLKRQVTEELLSACCEHASEAELDRLGMACFALGDAARWEQERPKWMALEFELLREAAIAARRPGHLLLIHSLERAFRAMAERVAPSLDGPSVSAWAMLAMNALGDRQVQPLRTHLPALLKSRDEHVLAALAPTCEAGEMPQTLSHQVQAPELARSAPALGTSDQALEVNPSGDALSPATQAPEVGEAEPEPTETEVSGARWENLSGCPTGSCEAPPTVLLPAPVATDPGHLPSGAVPEAATAEGHLETPAAQAPGLRWRGASPWLPGLVTYSRQAGCACACCVG